MMQYALANAQIHDLLRDRVEVPVRQPDATTLPEKLTITKAPRAAPEPSDCTC